jgi:hypothetical protein
MTSRTGPKSTTKTMDLEEGASLIPPPSSDDIGLTSTHASSATTTSGGASTGRTRRKVKRVRKKTVDHSPLIKYGSLVLLVAQLVGLVMLMRYSRTHSNGKDMYLSTTAVFCMEVRMDIDICMLSLVHFSYLLHY